MQTIPYQLVVMPLALATVVELVLLLMMRVCSYLYIYRKQQIIHGTKLSWFSQIFDGFPTNFNTHSTIQSFNLLLFLSDKAAKAFPTF